MGARGREAALRRWQDPEYRAHMLELRRSRPVLTDEQRKARRRAYYERNAETIKARAKAWHWANRERANKRAREYARANAEAARARYDAWISIPENRARVNELNRRYAKNNRHKKNAAWHRYRARLLGQFVEDVDRLVVLANYGGLCGWCGDPVDPKTFHVDHIVALCLGGEHSYANTQPTHPECNYRKRVVLKERAA